MHWQNENKPWTMHGDEAKYQCYITSKFNARWHTAKWIERILAEGMGRLYKCRWREKEACRKGLPPVFSRVFWLSSHPTQTKGIHVVVYVLENKRMFNIIFIQNTSDHKYCKWQIYCPPYTYYHYNILQYMVYYKKSINSDVKHQNLNVFFVWLFCFDILKTSSPRYFVVIKIRRAKTTIRKA